MLLSLRIENFALIDCLELDFAAGLNVLTGETGAGKSIILDALDAILGGKATARLIRTGAERALLEATFQISARLQDWLVQQEIDPLDANLLICSRELALSQGTLRSRSRLNGVIVNRQQLDGLRQQLVAITAQGQAVQLGQPSQQRQWLDEFGGPTLLQQRQQVGVDFSEFQQARQSLEAYRLNERQRLQQQDLLEYQLRELQQAELTEPDEQTQLLQEQQRLAHSVELQQQSYQVYQLLYDREDGQACGDLLGQASALLEQMSDYDPQVQPILEMIQEALTQVQEAGRLVNDYGAELEADPQRLAELQERLAQLKQVTRKYGPSLADALAYQQKITAELATLNGGDQSLDVLEQRYQLTQTHLEKSCQQLSQQRQTTAQKLEAELLRQLKPLAMERVQFQAALEPTTPSAQGSDQVKFLFSPNPGQPLQPLSETASGGEMSRFLLALQACFSQVDPVGSLVFDEIDVGVSGRVAQAIAEKLYQLSLGHQVLCVTHQPLVAAMADRHFLVEKQVVTSTRKTKSQHAQFEANNGERGNGAGNQEQTIVRVSILDQPQRQKELAQLAGGRSAEQAITFAQALLQQAASLRNQT